MPTNIQVHRSTGVGIISFTRNLELSKRHVEFLTSHEAKEIYSDFGWIHEMPA